MGPLTRTPRPYARPEKAFYVRFGSEDQAVCPLPTRFQGDVRGQCADEVGGVEDFAGGGDADGPGPSGEDAVDRLYRGAAGIRQKDTAGCDWCRRPRVRITIV
jgi:hypothetical protein